MTITDSTVAACKQQIEDQQREWNHDADAITQTAREYADALLTELERTK